jgi:hypothetical protein
MAPRLKRANRALKFPWWLVIFVVAEFSLASALLILHLAMVIIEGAWYFDYYVPGLVAVSVCVLTL